MAEVDVAAALDGSVERSVLASPRDRVLGYLAYALAHCRCVFPVGHLSRATAMDRAAVERVMTAIEQDGPFDLRRYDHAGAELRWVVRR